MQAHNRLFMLPLLALIFLTFLQVNPSLSWMTLHPRAAGKWAAWSYRRKQLIVAVRP